MRLIPRTASREGFTLIELLIVIAILAFVTVIGIRSYGNLKETQAKKMNATNIQRVHHALATYETIMEEEGATGYFKNFDSLIDVSSSGPWYGAAGTIDFGTWNASKSTADARQVNGGLGIYDGSWKALSAVYNAAGAGSGATPDLASAMEDNRGMRQTGLYQKLGIYYLSDADATLLRNAGITQVLLHNPSTAQASGTNRGGFCTALSDDGKTAEGLKSPGGGGPGFRPDMSAFYPVAVTNGLPVALVIPTADAYKDFGLDLGITNAAPSVAEITAAVAKTKLIAFGIGQNAECVRSQLGLGDAPYSPVYKKTDYRQYIAVFAIKTGGQGVASTCRLAGVLDCAGQTHRAAAYGVNWTSKVQ